VLAQECILYTKTSRAAGAPRGGPKATYIRPMSSRTRIPDQPKICAVCGKPQVERFRPFCSRRCADVDLHRWLSGTYALPALEDEDGEAPARPGEKAT